MAARYKVSTNLSPLSPAGTDAILSSASSGQCIFLKKNKASIIYLIAIFILIASGIALAAPVIKLEPVVSGFAKPVFITHAGDESGRLFIKPPRK